jgi:hypothetical protein
MRSYKRTSLAKSILAICVFAVFGSALMVGLLADWSGPILSEVNPNGTIDEWYLFDNAYGSRY